MDGVGDMRGREEEEGGEGFGGWGGWLMGLGIGGGKRRGGLEVVHRVWGSGGEGGWG